MQKSIKDKEGKKGRKNKEFKDRKRDQDPNPNPDPHHLLPNGKHATS